MNAEARETTLGDEYLRPTPGLRPFSLGIYLLARKLGLRTMIKPPAGAAPIEQDEVTRDMLVLTWLMDERNALEAVKRAAYGDPAVFAKTIDDYEFQLDPSLFVAAQLEIRRANGATQEAAFEIEQKPGGPKGPSPTGKG